MAGVVWLAGHLGLVPPECQFRMTEGLVNSASVGGMHPETQPWQGLVALRT